MDRVGGVPEHILAALPQRPGPGTTEVRFHHCTRADGSLVEWLSTPGPAVATPPGAPSPTGPSAEGLARLALADLVLPTPHLVTAPPAGIDFLVGFPVWYWVTDWQPRSRTASVVGLSATATAIPVETDLEFDDGTDLRCAGPGTAWKRGVPDHQQHSDCTHVFTHHDTHAITVTVRWRLSWSATNGASGSLPPVARSATVTRRAYEAQAVID